MAYFIEVSEDANLEIGKAYLYYRIRRRIFRAS